MELLIELSLVLRLELCSLLVTSNIHVNEKSARRDANTARWL